MKRGDKTNLEAELCQAGWMTLRAFADAIGISYVRARQLCKNGTVAFVTLFGRKMIHHSQLEKALTRNKKRGWPKGKSRSREPRYQQRECLTVRGTATPAKPEGDVQ